MAQIIRLHGGPWHGHEMSIPDGHNHFHIAGLSEDVVTQALQARTQGEAETVIYREGTYSRVRGSRGDFEWDGWSVR